jgi:hypothetical protein
MVAVLRIRSCFFLMVDAVRARWALSHCFGPLWFLP